MTNKTSVPTYDLKIKKQFSVSAKTLFQAWTDPIQMKQWFCPDKDYTIPIVEVDLKVGGSYRLDMKYKDGMVYTVRGLYKTIEPNKKLAFTWSWEGDPEESLVTLQFYPQEHGTELILTHNRFQNILSRDKHQEGWVGCLDHLEKFTK